ncbi:MAG: disulfide bond formation protein B [Candidatus Paceibacterota bacterium]
METFTEWFDFIGAVGTLLGLVGIAIYAPALFVDRGRFFRNVRRIVARFRFLAGFVLSLSALLATLVYSQFIGYAPCELCWLQRIALYPQVVVFGVALIQRELREYFVPLILSLAGVLFALIHIYIQVTDDLVFCAPGEVACSTVYVTEFGFITLPVMALILFVLLGLIALGGLLERRAGSGRDR